MIATERLQYARKAVLLVAVVCGPYIVLGESRWSEDVHETIEWTGVIPVVACIVGSSTCMKAGCCQLASLTERIAPDVR